MKISKISEFQSKSGATLYSMDFTNTVSIPGIGVTTQVYGRLIVEKLAEGAEEGAEVELPAHRLVAKELTTKEGEKFSINFITF